MGTLLLYVRDYILAVVISSLALSLAGSFVTMDLWTVFDDGVEPARAGVLWVSILGLVPRFIASIP